MKEGNGGNSEKSQVNAMKADMAAAMATNNVVLSTTDPHNPPTFSMYIIAMQCIAFLRLLGYFWSHAKKFFTLYWLNAFDFMLEDWQCTFFSVFIIWRFVAWLVEESIHLSIHTQCMYVSQSAGRLAGLLLAAADIVRFNTIQTIVNELSEEYTQSFKMWKYFQFYVHCTYIFVFQCLSLSCVGLRCVGLLHSHRFV